MLVLGIWGCAIKHFPKDQPVRRRAHSRYAPIPFRQHSFDFLSREFTQADLHERAHNSTTHFVEKAVAFDNKCD